MTRARRDLRWREQAARLVAEACWPGRGDDLARRVLGSPVDSQPSMPFDVAKVRAYCERLISEADALDLQRAVFADWTRDRGMGPENREGGAFVPINLNALAILPPPPTVPLRWRFRFHRFYPREVVIRLSAQATTPEAIAAEIHKGRGMLDARCVNGRVVLSMRGGWPGRLAREYVATQRARRRCSRRDCEGGVLTRPLPALTDGDAGKLLSLVRRGDITAADARDIAVGACPECKQFNATRTPRTFANGGTLRRAAQRLLDTLDGRCPWAPDAEAQASECDVCDGRGETGPEWPAPAGTRLWMAVSPGVQVVGEDGRPREAKIGEQLRGPCDACSGTGHNLRGTLPPLPDGTVARLTPTLTAEETPEWDGWPLPVAE